jgi:hypothetical protein
LRRSGYESAENPKGSAEFSAAADDDGNDSVKFVSADNSAIRVSQAAAGRG